MRCSSSWLRAWPLALLATAGPAQAQRAASFAAVTTFSTAAGSQPYDVAVADVNGDGWPDLLTANYTNNTVGVFTEYGRGCLREYNRV